jgi:putative ABC transport system permease protein
MIRLLPFDHAIRNLGRSWRRLLLVSGGSAVVSLLVVGAIAFGRGLERSLGESGLARNMLLVGAGSEDSLERSEIPATVAGIAAASLDGLATAAGEPVVSPEIHAALPCLADDALGAPYAGDATLRAPPVLIRGVERAAFAAHPQVRLAEGRWPVRGADEIALGLDAARRIGASTGDGVRIAGERLVVVGLLSAPGTVMHGEAWMRLDRLAALLRRTSHSCVVVGLGEAEEADLESFALSRLDLEISAMREDAYFARLAEFLGPIRVLVAASALLVATGGVLGGLNGMYAAFASRVREVATLQAIGFSRTAIAVSLAIESTVACVAGSLVATAASFLLLDDIVVHLSMGSFRLVADETAIAGGLVAGLLLGLVGATPPVLRSLSISIPAGLRA